MNWPYEPGYQPESFDYMVESDESIIREPSRKDLVIGPMEYTFSLDKTSEYFEEMRKMSLLEKKIIFYRNYLPYTQIVPSCLNMSQLMAVMNSLYMYDLCDEDRVEEYALAWRAEVKNPVSTDFHDVHFLGLAEGRILTEEENEDLYLLNDYFHEGKSGLFKKKLAKLKESLGEIPYLEYMGMLKPRADYQKISKAKLSEALRKYPDFVLFRLEMGFLELEARIKKNKKCELLRFEDYFPEGHRVHVRELLKFQALKIFTIIYKGDLEAADALLENLDQLGLDPEAKNVHLNFVNETKIEMLHQYFSKEQEVPYEVYQLKVELLGIQPRIWRRILVGDNIGLEELHNILQITMGWTDSHLHAFIRENVRFESYDPDNENWWEMAQIDYSGFKVRDLIERKGQQLKYEYDFGDGWKHLLTLEKIEYYKPGIQLPTCLEGEHKCPPEDVGSTTGYRKLLRILANPDHPEYKDYLNWVGGSFDPEEFDPEKINQYLANPELWEDSL